MSFLPGWRHAWIGVVVVAYVAGSLVFLLRDPVWVVAWLVAAAVVVSALCVAVLLLVRVRPTMLRLDQQAEQTREHTEQIRKHTQQWEAARAAVVALARKTQHSAHRIQAAANEMASRHPEDPDALETSMRVDHEAAQQARQAQTLAVMFGEFPGQQWPAAVALEDVVRAAAGRITGYRRVEVNGDCGLAAKPPVVEPLIHALAELLANATEKSPPNTQVLVAVRGVQRGAIVEIDDGGIGVDDQQIEDLIDIASGRNPVDLASLGEVPQTGLRAVGVLAGRYGFRVELKHSVYGGLKAVLLVPAEQIDIVAPTRTVVPTPPALEVASPPEVRGESDFLSTRTAPQQLISALGDGLPQRRHRRDEAAAPAAPKWPPPAAQDSPEQAGAFMESFFQGHRPGD